VTTNLLGEKGQGCGVHCGDDPVHHGGGKGHLPLDPRGQGRIHAASIVQNHAGEQATIVWNVVATHYG
jgi:hypothetical protein